MTSGKYFVDLFVLEYSLVDFVHFENSIGSLYVRYLKHFDWKWLQLISVSYYLKDQQELDESDLAH